jgi:hypothetical protein
MKLFKPTNQLGVGGRENTGWDIQQVYSLPEIKLNRC